MSATQILTAIVAPTLFWFAYHLYKDRHSPEPASVILLTYGLGIAAGWLGLRAYAALGWLGLRQDAYWLAEHDPAGLLLYAVLVIGFVEEGVKLLPFWLVGVRLHHFDEPVDGIIYASFVALGFATYENLLYLQHLDGSEALLRGIASPAVHVMFASIWGYTASRAQMRGHPVLPALLVGLMISAPLHGLYDFVTLGLSPWFRPIAAAIVLGIWIWRMRLIRRLTARTSVQG